MDGKLQTSFIPKKPLIDTTKKRSRPIGIFSMAAWFVFIVAVAAAGGLYAYNQLLKNNIATANANLIKKVNSFDTASVDQVSALNDRIEAAKSILASHTAVSHIFDLI